MSQQDFESKISPVRRPGSSKLGKAVVVSSAVALVGACSSGPVSGVAVPASSMPTSSTSEQNAPEPQPTGIEFEVPFPVSGEVTDLEFYRFAGTGYPGEDVAVFLVPETPAEAAQLLAVPNYVAAGSVKLDEEPWSFTVQVNDNVQDIELESLTVAFDDPGIEPRVVTPADMEVEMGDALSVSVDCETLLDSANLGVVVTVETTDDATLVASLAADTLNIDSETGATCSPVVDGTRPFSLRSQPLGLTMSRSFGLL